MKYLVLFQLFFIIHLNITRTLYEDTGENLPGQDTTHAEKYEGIEILDEFFFFWAKSHGNEPIIGILLFNNTPYTISSIDFRAELKSRYEDITWVEDEFGYTPEKWITPYETLYAEFNFAYNWNWDNPDIKESEADLTIEFLNVYDTLGDLILFEKSSD